jgi:AcrR family transcriptional regulator
MAMVTDIRSRARDAVRLELAEAVIRVFADRGYDAVTVEEAATAVGVSRATFFRYFPTKEDVVVTAVESGHPDYAAALAAVPVGAHSGWGLARAALELLVVDVETNPRGRRERMRIIGDQPSLRARFVERRQRLVAEYAAALTARTGDADEAIVLASAASAALDVAWHEWAADDALGFRAAVDSAFRRLEAGSAMHVVVG